MNFQSSRSDNAPLAEASELKAGKKHLRCSRMLGKLSACIFFVVALAVIDGLQTLMRQEFNAIALVPGETATISGLMPQKAAHLADMVVEMEGLPGLTFRPVASFKGFWMGGDMWRGELTAGDNALPGKGTLIVVDMVPMKKVGQTAVRDENGGSDKPAATNSRSETIMAQNPALMYTVTVWLSADERDAAELSFLRRFTGQAPFAVAAAAAAAALMAGIGNFVFFAKAEALLSRQGIYVIHGVKQQEDGLHASFAHAGANDFFLGDVALLYDAHWREQGQGVIADKNHVKGFARFAPGCSLRYGWLVALDEKKENARTGA
ncbi:MAG: hypothetical protein LBD42_06935 [Desulfovibrio sp.]|jgi:hypothetical protein|nr:hypothetical protein [Desulfovibrio sp.]